MNRGKPAPVRSVLYLQPRGGDAQALIDFYRRERVFERAMRQPGCLSCELQVAADGEGPLLVTALWESSAAYDGWVENPWRQQNATALNALVEGGLGPGTRGQLYEVVLGTGGFAGEADRGTEA